MASVTGFSFQAQTSQYTHFNLRRLLLYSYLLSMKITHIESALNTMRDDTYTVYILWGSLCHKCCR